MDDDTGVIVNLIPEIFWGNWAYSEHPDQKTISLIISSEIIEIVNFQKFKILESRFLKINNDFTVFTIFIEESNVVQLSGPINGDDMPVMLCIYDEAMNVLALDAHGIHDYCRII